MTVGIDFDNTIVNTFETSKKYLDEYLPGNNLVSYHELEVEEQIKFFNKYYLKITENLHVFEGVKDALDFFKSHNIKVILLTARNYRLMAATKKFLKEKGLEFDDYIFGAYPKGKEAKDNNIDFVIDDSIEVALDVRSYKIKVIQFGVDKSSWPEIIDYFRREII